MEMDYSRQGLSSIPYEKKPTDRSVYTVSHEGQIVHHATACVTNVSIKRCPFSRMCCSNRKGKSSPLIEFFCGFTRGRIHQC